MTIIDQLADFLVRHNKYVEKDKVKEYIAEHLKYGTIDWCVDNDEIVAMVRWNVRGDTFEVLDMSVDEKYRKQGLGTEFIKRGLKKWPDVKWLEFKRGVRGDERIRKVSINHILKKEWF